MEVISIYHQTEEQITNEYKLIQDAIQNPTRFEVLYNRYYDRIASFVYQRLDDKQLAFDVTSQVFLKALTKLPDYTYKGVPFSSWLFRIAYNELCDLFKKRSSLRTINIDTQAFRSLAVENENKEEQEYYLSKMAEAIATLPEREMELIEMRFFDQLSFKEIGNVLGITENNAKVRVYRILDKIKKNILQKVEQDEKN